MEIFFPMPFKNREATVYGFGANRIFHNGSILVIAKSVEFIKDPILVPYVEDF